MGSLSCSNKGVELYGRFLGGEQDMLASLVELYGSELTLYISKIIGDIDDAEDLMIDAFARLVQRKAAFDNESALKSYLFKTGRHLALRYRKKHEKYPVSIEEIEDVLECVSPSELPEENTLREERKRQLVKAMALLKEDHQRVLRLLYFENMSYADAGRMMEKTARQIDGLAYRAKASLKKKLESEGFSY